MIGAATACIVATRSGTRIFAALVYTGPIRRTLGTGHTLGLAVGRSTHVVWQAGTHRTLPNYMTSAEQATRRRSTRVFGQG